jgi:hypothetical protein
MVTRRKTLEHEDAEFMSEARGYCLHAGYKDVYPAIDRRINYGDEYRVDPMSMVTVLGSSRPKMDVNDSRFRGSMEQSLERDPHIYHSFPPVQVIE